MRFVDMGEGICKDSLGRRYDSATFSNSTAAATQSHAYENATQSPASCEEACVEVNPPMSNIVLVGIAYGVFFGNNACKCFFTEGYLNRGCLDGAKCIFSMVGSGPVNQTGDGTGKTCYKNPDFTQIADDYSSVPQETLGVVAELMGNLTAVRGDVLLLEEKNHDIVATNAGLMGNLTAMSANLAALEGTNANLLAKNNELWERLEKCLTESPKSPKQADSDEELVVEFPKLKKVNKNLNPPGGSEKKGLRHGL
eukprot:CAMPEP_0172527710 /NCGR_PEP_ID=MMETSP1067-20121228/2328_1 /TAXON_ID=265564 ORGANISM="Thalassiosira punctigera, Strain Tpunct2005C2" /NCGR_SAMPLE_ID=MMETSP1067 /ASSEMBLY_ACC=CAM_ASM_000444 /LENGTH=253 /DNA_ID=CAMNT_0013311503 /DNA_START=31 /DNA_END=792 /DNA_ORIENTATION=+